MTIWAMKLDEGGTWAESVCESLTRGEGRFGWSYVETANLYDLRDRIKKDGWNDLNEERTQHQGPLKTIYAT